jgi:Na+/phosphate symporter
VVAAFKLFDGFLPVVDPTGGRTSRMATTIYRPWFTFLFGMAVTSITLSVSVSLTLLVPLTVKGLVRRENLIPYVMGANITTFVDTLIFTLLLERTGGFTIVLSQIVSVTTLSLPAVLLLYRPLERAIDAASRRATKDRLHLALFVLLILAIPLGLILI